MFISFACRRTGENVRENTAKPFPTLPVLVVVHFTEEASLLKKEAIPKSAYSVCVVVYSKCSVLYVRGT